MDTRTRRVWILYIVIFVTFGLIGYLMPLVGDDLNWGSAAGARYFSSGLFLTYDGRYLGDLLVIILTRFPFVTFIVYGLTAVIISVLIAKIINIISPNNDCYLISILLSALGLILVPRGIYSQTWGWHAGFANYVPSVIFPLFFIYLIASNYNDVRIKSATSKLKILALFIISLLSQFFVEHITILNCFNVFITWMFLRKHFKQEFKHKELLWITLGNFFGAFLMFINGAYIKILLGKDNYRKVAGHSSNLLPYVKNFVFSWKVFFLLIFVVLFCVSYIYLKNPMINLLNVVLLGGAFISVVPFVIISPFGPRCLFACYVLLITMILINVIPWYNSSWVVAAPLLLIAFLFLGFRQNLIAEDYRDSYKLSRMYCSYQNTIKRDKYYVLGFKDIRYIWTDDMHEDTMFKYYFISVGDKKIVPVRYDEWRRYKTDLEYNIGEFDRKITELKSQE